MNEKLKKTLEWFMKHPIVVDSQLKQKNVVQMSGWVIKKPKITHNEERDTYACSFVIYQYKTIGRRAHYSSYTCMTYIPELVKQFGQQENVIMLGCVGKIETSKKYGHYINVTELVTLCELDDPLVDGDKEN